MSNFNAFLATNVKPIENKKLIVSKRFQDEKGNPIEWEIRAIMSDENDELQKRATVDIPVKGQRGVYQREVDQIKYMNLLAATACVYPDLRSAEIQDSYGVKSPEALITKMLLPNEFTRLVREIVNFSDLEDLDTLTKQAKN